MNTDTAFAHNEESNSAFTPHTYTVSIKDKSGDLVPDPLELRVKVGDSVVWSYDEPRPFYVSFSPFTKYSSKLEDGRQSITLPVVEDLSFPARYEVGHVGKSDSSWSGGIITCSTCPPGD